MKPESETSDLDGSEKRFGVFGVSGSDAAPAFEVKESVFDKVTASVKILVVWPLSGAVFLRRDHRNHALGGGLCEDHSGIVALVGDQVIGVDPLDQATGLCAIRPGTFCNNNSDRQPLRLHSQRYRGVEPPWMRLMAWLPLTAPVACGWTLQ